MKSYRIAVVAGDGIGPEVINSVIDVLKETQRIVGRFELEFVEAPAGAGVYLEQGTALPESSLATCRDADAILLGACGLPDVRYPDGTEITPQVSLRKLLDLYAGIRPAHLLKGIPSPLAGPPKIDFVVVRESTEGFFASQGGGILLGDQVATDTLVITRKGTERVVRAAFELARRRNRENPKVTCVDKANIFRSFAFFRTVFDEVAQAYPDIAADHLYVDAAAMEMVRRPGRFDVIVTENLLGDILSDLAAGLVGGLGMAPSADIGNRHAVFQPCHGTAPDIAGTGRANPIATILSSVMMLDHLADRHQDDGLRTAARSIEAAVGSAIESGGSLTADLGGQATTGQVTSAILDRLCGSTESHRV
jgi:3-isopropylmalate dehydrogenase